ncbi:uncharacterized protein LOC124911331 [Impatiens glandulifera]|uniref:uncharacterized protein LOC124911331 n=1 Tax=Impatiens glandulifera TaxID=253017 RepID=UPI001FB17C6E|nr:uncharacterized protein LOC124911331 [Impatiens glandulifera]
MGRITCHSSMILAESVSWYCTVLLAMMLLMSICDTKEAVDDFDLEFPRVDLLVKQRCDDIYVVQEGDTLQTIGEKCGDPYIVEENPHIHDPDDVIPGLLLKITHFTT